MESLKDFQWVRDTAAYRLAWMPTRGKKAHWLKAPTDEWSKMYDVDQSTHLDISTTQYAGEQRIAKSGIYISGERQWINRNKNDEMWRGVTVKPFATDSVVSLNLISSKGSPKDWLDFTNRYGLIGHSANTERWHLIGKEKRSYISQLEHEGEWHHLRNVLFRIYKYFPAIRDRDEGLLSSYINWESDDVVREIGQKFSPAIAMRGKYGMNEQYFRIMNRNNLFIPAAISIVDHVNSYLKTSLSLEISFDPNNLQFHPSLRYGSLGAAIVAEAVEFIAERFEAKSCIVCGTWFRIGNNHKRKDRIFCSSACKMRDYRARRSK